MRIVFPNGELWGKVVKVPSRNDTERVELKFTRPITDDVGMAIDRIKEIIARDKRITHVAQIGIDTVNAGDFVIVARVWVTRHEAMQVHFDLNRAIKEDFQRSPPETEQARAAD